MQLFLTILTPGSGFSFFPSASPAVLFSFSLDNLHCLEGAYALLKVFEEKMRFSYRVGKSKLNAILGQPARSYVQLPYRSLINSTTLYLRPCDGEIPHWIFHNRPADMLINPRFFAAPAWVKSKKEEDEAGETQLNEQIKARFVRLVTDDGHSVVSIHEALARAKMLNLDLVEVQRNANPPVCKIMDFHKEKYKREVTEKDRAKSKSESTLRKGEGKEVRFSLKTEHKDLKNKADSVKRLMERGYRVKCKVAGPDLKMGRDENLNDFEARIAKHIEELRAGLSRLSDMIADVCVIESGPHASVKEASMIVRHEKFGRSKKGGAKKKEAATVVTQTQCATSDDADDFSDEKNDDDFIEVPEVVSSQTPNPASKITGSATLDKPVNVFENRYRKTEPQNQYQSAGTSMNNKNPYNSGSVMREPFTQKPVNIPEDRSKPMDQQNRHQSVASVNDKAAGSSGSFRRDSQLNQRARST